MRFRQCNKQLLLAKVTMPFLQEALLIHRLLESPFTWWARSLGRKRCVVSSCFCLCHNFHLPIYARCVRELLCRRLCLSVEACWLSHRSAVVGIHGYRILLLPPNSRIVISESSSTRSKTAGFYASLDYSFARFESCNYICANIYTMSNTKGATPKMWREFI